MLNRPGKYRHATQLLMLALTCGTSGETIANDKSTLEEVIVTAQKREQRLQDIPVAVTVVDSAQLEVQGITGLDGFSRGAVPSLRVQHYPLTPSSLVLAIRGNGPTDAGQITREGSVAVYTDGYYRSRAQGLAVELADIERIEILRGPQGTLFGRNATGGAINVISKKPTGKFDLRQTIGVGRYDERRSVTRVNLPAFAGIKAKLDYLYTERDGWVKNTAPAQADYNTFEKGAGKLTLYWSFNDQFNAEYIYDRSRDEASQLYFQLATDTLGFMPVENGRQTHTRFPIAPLKPTEVEQQGHGLTLTWTLSENLVAKSLTGYRELNENTDFNFAGALYSNGFINRADIESNLFTQELQLLGTHDSVNWVFGVFYLDEEVENTDQLFFWLDSFGLITGTPTTPIPLTTFGLPSRDITSDSESQAVYAQATWTPPVGDERLAVTAGLRYTDDVKSGARIQGDVVQRYDGEDDGNDTDNIDGTVAIHYRWHDQLATYVKWSSAYQAGGVNLFSNSFSGYDREEAEAYEIGLKSEFFNRRARLNAAVFSTEYDGKVLDFIDPANAAITETINATDVEVDGAEIELTLAVSSQLQVGLNYTYLDARMPLQPNPLNDCDTAVDPKCNLTPFDVTQSPKHAGSLTLDYSVDAWSFGDLSLHLGITSTDDYAYTSPAGDRRDGYTLFNGRLALDEVNIGQHQGVFKIEAWWDNITDEEYVATSFSLTNGSVTEAYGTPRTAGIAITYTFE